MATAYRAGRLLSVWGYVKALLESIKLPATAGIHFVYQINAVALTGDMDTVMPNKVRVIDVWAVGTGTPGAGDTIIVKNTANVISSTLDMNIADTTIARATTLNDAYWDIAAGGTLRVSGASAVNAAVFVECMLVA